MPGELSADSQTNNMARSPFDAPEVAARFNGSVKGATHISPSSKHGSAQILFSSPPGWNIAPARPQSNGQTLSASKLAMSSTGSPGTSEQEGRSNDFWSRYEQVKSLEDSKNLLIEEILCRYEYLGERYQKVLEEHQRNSEYSKTAHLREKRLIEDVQRLESRLSCDQFIFVLIDGNGLAFQDELLSMGEKGGREAAARLHANVVGHVNRMFPDLEPTKKVTARVYADVKGISEAYLGTGIVDNPSTVDEFFRGFTRGKSLFDIVDVGPGKGRTVQKVQDQFKLHLHDLQCRQIMLGCSHDETYASLLESLRFEQQLSGRVTLLEGLPSIGESQDRDFETCHFSDLFRNTALEPQGPVGWSSSSVSPLSRTTSIETPPSTISRQLSELSIKDVKVFTPNPPTAKPASITPSVTTSVSSAKPSPITTWASAAAKPPTNVIEQPPLPAPAASTGVTIARNRLGQRIDTQIKHDKAEVDRVKKMKMCNVHFLRGPCPYGDDCSHSHTNKPTNAELQTLRLVARMAPCMHGSDCDDAKCIYGHICPAPEGRRGENCIFAAACRFPAQLHRIDRSAVKSFRV